MNMEAWERDGPWLRCKICGFRVISEVDAEGHERFHSSPDDELEVLVKAYGPQEAKRRWAEWQYRKKLLASQAARGQTPSNIKRNLLDFT